MATSQDNQSTTNTFAKGMMKDLNETFVGDGLWLHARNAVNNAHDGELNVLGNEPANLKCIELPYTLIGAIPINDGTWALFTTDDTNCEIGVFDANLCTYKMVVNSPNLNFRKTNLITGAARKSFDCGYKVYWDDARNPSRVMAIDNPPYITVKEKQGDCYIEKSTGQLDVEQLRLSQVLTIPCVNIEKGKASGTLRNGSYQVAIAYTVNSIRVTDYLAVSEVQPLFDHDGEGGSIDITVSNTDQDFDEFELVLISVVNQQTQAKRLGIYSVNQNKIFIDSIEPDLITIPLANIPLITPAVEKSDAMFRLNNYLVRTGIYNRLDFNYQPIANNIQAKWVAVEYPSDYYAKGGNNTGYMRDEQYAFFIRWVYNTGDKSPSFHIPGRDATVEERGNVFSVDAIELEDGVNPPLWQVRNTATITAQGSTKLRDGGVQVAEGRMGYWESTEIYPDNKPQVWGDLCGKPIRHHKFPDNTLSEATYHHSQGGDKIRIMGVKFDNIQHPVDNQGNPISSIVGYEILRGSREGNKTVIAKGMINNMREFNIPGTTNTKGLFQNYPYNDLSPDYYLTSNPGFIESGAKNNRLADPLTTYKKDTFSFHSPDTSFSRPYLNLTEMKVYSEIYGSATGNFEYVYKHPKFKQIGDDLTSISKLVGILTTVDIITGASKSIKFGGTEKQPLEFSIGGAPPSFPSPPSPGGGDVLGISSGVQAAVSWVAYFIQLATWTANVVALVAASKLIAEQYEEKIVSIIAGLIPERQYAAQYNSHGFYGNYTLNANADNSRRKIADSFYVNNNLQSYNNYRINNLDRSGYVLVNTTKDIADPKQADDSRKTKSQFRTDLNKEVSTNIAAYYTGLKISFPSQYGQLESIKQVPIYTCLYSTSPSLTARYATDIMFGGDIYIGRYTEKNPFMFFNDWLYDMPDGIDYNYRNYVSVAYPRYWLDNTTIRKIVADSPSSFRHLDDRVNKFNYVEQGFFYISCNGVRDFYVESEVNLAFRDWEEIPGKRHYDPLRYTDLNMMFRSDNVRSSNFYKYDYSLSVARLYNNYVSWGSLQPRDYDPLISEKCYTYSPNRMMYSLPQQTEQKQDNWVRFLPNNYMDMSSRVTALKSVGDNGAMIMLENESPILIQGVDTLQTDAGVKITIGDGGLFNQPMRNIINADDEYQYGSCQSKFAIAGIPAGVFWVSQEQGKIFQYGGQLNEITRSGMKWWFAKHLPSQLLRTFPNYTLADNPLVGVGCNMSYDNTNEVLYITKRDFKVINPALKYNTVDGFHTLGAEFVVTNQDGTKTIKQAKDLVKLGDPVHFEDASWTISYDPKANEGRGAFLSFHDWHPNFMIPGRSSFLTVKDKGIWRHNSRTDLYCNFYGKDYPFEVEFVSTTGQQVNTVRNVEYMLECYQYFNDGQERFHILDENFDRALVYNSEQISGNLHLVLQKKNDPLEMLKYPIAVPDGTQIQFTKEENKYRFNQFWDITKNRGEFVSNPLSMFDVSSNGYTKTINPRYVDYGKDPLERKKFRHYANRVFLRKNVSNSTKMLFKLINTKLQHSFR
jgi:hypothetical protein